MSSVFDYKDFKDFLYAELHERLKRNKNYSLRAYARDINFSNSRLSHVLKGKEGISLKTAHNIASALNMTSLETEYFINLILSKFGRSQKVRENALAAIVNKKHTQKFLSIKKQQQVGLLSKWYFLALIEILCLNQLISEDKLAHIFNISVNDLASSMRELQDCGYIKKNSHGQWVKNNQFIKVESSTPSPLIQDYHLQMMNKAKSALNEQEIPNRKYLSGVFAFNKNKLAEARSELEELQIKFFNKYAEADEPNSVYAISMQFFEMTPRTQDGSRSTKKDA